MILPWDAIMLSGLAVLAMVVTIVVNLIQHRDMRASTDRISKGIREMNRILNRHLVLMRGTANAIDTAMARRRRGLGKGDARPGSRHETDTPCTDSVDLPDSGGAERRRVR